MTHLPSFILFRDLVCVYQHNQSRSALALSENLFRFFFFAYSCRPLSDNADIYTFTLIPYNLLNYDL